MTDSSFEELARKPLLFALCMHAFPRDVKTGLNREAEFVIKTLTSLTFKLLSPRMVNILRER